ncbi:hypothetical protein [Sorangium sp. So ce1335]|uniref:hypothetical protein n=1 Tax=Sorangium sp. So ce1335 TaxID=3133335 RepID=UPI003F5EDC7A
MPIAWIGVYEGFYNHVLKDALYFLAPGSRAFVRLFPPPLYEVPDNALFEITGVLQVVPAWVAAAALARRLLAGRRRVAHAGRAAAVSLHRMGSSR